MRIWKKAPIAAATTLALTLAVAGSVGITPVGATPVVAAAPSATGTGAGTATSTGTDGRVDLIQATSSAGVAAPRSLARSVQSPAAIASAHVGTYARALDVDPATLSYEQTAATAAGDSVRFGQSVADVPVLGSGVTVSQTADGAMQSINSRTTPLAASAFPALSATSSRDYRTLAATTVALREHRRDAGALTVSGPARYWYDPAVLGAPDAAHALSAVVSYRVTGPGLAYQVLVNVRTGAVTLAWSTQERALNRVVCDLKNKAVDTLDPATYRCNGKAANYARSEGQPASSVSDVNKVYAYFGATAAAYKANSKVDLTSLIGTDYQSDGKSKAIRGTVRVCNIDFEGGVKECPYRNAFWDGRQMAFGTGVVTDDITAHELTHGVTQKTSGLQYLWQSGAINESMSDVFGEFVDLKDGSSDDSTANAWLIGEGSSLGVIRSLKRPSDYDQPARMSSGRWDPDEGFFDNGGVHTNSGVGNKAAYLITHGGSFYGISVRGLGVAKAWKIYWSTQNMLPSGADYRDLAVTLSAACANLVGKSGTGISTADCSQVSKAIKATQMTQNPTRDAPTSTLLCPAVAPTRTLLHHEGFEKGSTWIPTPAGGTRTWFQSQTTRMQESTLAAAAEGAGSYMYLPRTDGRSYGYLTQPGTWTIPKSTKGSVYLRFEHQFFLGAEGVAGAELQYSIDNGRHWLSATDQLPDQQGQNSKPSMLSGHGGFTGVSNGFGSSRYNMTSLKGKSVKLRFHVRSPGGDAIWWVDNLQLNACR